MVDKSQWPIVDPGFVMVPPKLERSVGRPRVKRIKSKGELGKRGPYQCKRCFQFGHIEKGCGEPPTELSVELPPPAPKSRKRKVKSSTSTSKNAPKKSKILPAPSTSLVRQPVSTGPTTRTMAAGTSSPLSPGPTTRSRAAADISPGGIARRLIIG